MYLCNSSQTRTVAGTYFPVWELHFCVTAGVSEEHIAMQKGRRCWLQAGFGFFWLHTSGTGQLPLPPAGCFTSCLMARDFSHFLPYPASLCFLDDFLQGFFKASSFQGGSVLLSLTQNWAAAFCNYKKGNCCGFNGSFYAQASIILLVVYFLHSPQSLKLILVLLSGLFLRFPFVPSRWQAELAPGRTSAEAATDGYE